MAYNLQTQTSLFLNVKSHNYISFII